MSDDITQGVNQVIGLNNELNHKEATNTLGHEAFVHADKDADSLNKIDEKVENGSYNSDTKEYIRDVKDVSNSADKDHKALGEGKITKFENYSKELTKQKNDDYYEEAYKKEIDRFKKEALSNSLHIFFGFVMFQTW